MSDSEDEAFQSADEGDNPKSQAKPKEPLPAAAGKRKQKRNRKKKGARQSEGEEKNEPVKAAEVGETSKNNSNNNKDDNVVSSTTCKESKVSQEKTAIQETEKETDTPSKDEKTSSATAEEPKQTPAAAPEKTPAEEPEKTPAKSNSSSERVEGIVAEQPSTLPDVEAVSPEKPTEQHESILEKLSDAAKPSGAGAGGGAWGGWGSWGSSILSTATSSVSTFTQQVGEGLNTVLETVESTLGAPDPEELAKQDRMARDAKEPDETPNGRSECSTEELEEVQDEIEDNQSNDEKNEASGWAPWGGWGGLSQVTKAVGETGKTLMSGGLDVLESIGKTTFNAIAEGDHGIKNTLRKTGQKPNLSQILRDAKDEHAERSKMMEQYEEARKANFGALFDENNGLVHLEALEQVSAQCESKVQSLLGTMSHSDLNTLRKDLIAIKDKFEVDEESDDEEEIEADAEHSFREQCKEIMVELGLPLTSDRLAQSFDKCRTWLKDCQEEMQQGVKMSPKEAHRVAIQSMAELTANGVQQFHKVSQLLQMSANGPLSIHVNRADCLSRLTKLLCTEVEYISVKFTSCLNSFSNETDMSSEINPLVTNVYLEASNSKTYVQDAFRLLLPVVQHTALLAYSREKQESEES